MKRNFFPIILAIALLWGGGQGLYTVITNRAPTEYSVHTYLRERPSEKWLRLTDGILDMTGVNYSRGIGQISEVYVPLRPVDSGSGDTVQILLASKDPALLELAERMRSLKTEEDVARFIEKEGNQLLIQKTVQGLIRFGIELKTQDVRKLMKLNANLSEDFIVLAEGEQPEIAVSAVLFLLGVAAAVWVTKRMLRGPGEPSSPQPPPLPKRPGGPPPLPSSQRA